MRRRLLTLLPSFLLVACATKYTPPESATPRSATSVNASQGRTWDAVIDVFAERNIPIRNMERVSGFIVTEELGIADTGSVAWADCGKVPNSWGAEKKRGKSAPKQKDRPLAPSRASYNVLVRGDSARSTVRATVRWTTPGTVKAGPIECSTRGTWESIAEQEVKRRAEAESSTASASSSRLETRTLVDTVPPGTRWIANRRTKIYYQVGCAAADGIAPVDRLYYATESAVLTAGFRAGPKC
jgi:hypothetical protein